MPQKPETVGELRSERSWREFFRKRKFMTESTMQELAVKLRKSCVTIGTTQILEDLRGNAHAVQGVGSGFVVSQKKGWIMTNYHVVKNAAGGKLGVHFSGENEVRSATVVTFDEAQDLAIIKIEGRVKVPELKLGNSNGVRSGQRVLAFGSPLGLSGSLRDGIVSVRRRLVHAKGTEEHIQHTAAINPGDSGGPLVNAHGEVVGINNMIVSRSGGNDGLGFAIPARFAEDLIGKAKKIRAE